MMSFMYTYIDFENRFFFNFCFSNFITLADINQNSRIGEEIVMYTSYIRLRVSRLHYIPR